MPFPLHAYFHFLRHSKNQYGIHSPFVYHLITRCFYDRHRYPAYQKINRYRKALADLPSQNGSPRIGSRRKLHLLHRLRSYFKVRTALVCGPAPATIIAALSADHNPRISAALPKAKAAQKLRKNLDTVNLSAEILTAQNSSFTGLEENEKFDLLFWQDTVACSLFNDFLDSKPHLHQNSLLIFEGIHQRPEREADWEKIKQDYDLHVTIDIFFWGIAFLRKGQAKQHFNIRV